MEDDPRLEEYRKATEEMAKTGRLSFSLESMAEGEEDDPVGQLGNALYGLTRNIDSRFRELERLSRISLHIGKGLRLEEILQEIHSAFAGELPYDRISIATTVGTGSLSRLQWLHSSDPDRIGNELAEGPLTDSLGVLLEEGAPRIINELELHLARHPDSQSARQLVRAQLRSCLLCPLQAMGRPVGIICFASKKRGVYRESHKLFFSRIAQQISLVIEKSALYDELIEAKRSLEHTNRQLARLAAIDGLTGIPNRRQLDETLGREWNRMLRAGGWLSCLMIDIDHFKRYNDHHGHLQGDECLRRVARRLRASLRRARDFVARYGGEEFTVVLAGEDPDGASRVARYLHRAVGELRIPHAGLSPEGRVSVSIGVASCQPCSGLGCDVLIEAADRQLYLAKQAGRDRIAATIIAPSDTTLGQPEPDAVP